MDELSKPSRMTDEQLGNMVINTPEQIAEAKHRPPRERMGRGMLRPRERAILEILPRARRIKDVPMLLERSYPDLTVDEVYGVLHRVKARALEAYSLIGTINHLRQTGPKVDRWLTPKARVDIKAKDPAQRLREAE